MNTMNTKFTRQQVENRYKTVLKRTKTTISNNRTSGSQRAVDPYGEEMSAIIEMDDSIVPEIHINQNNIATKSSENQQQSSPKSSTSKRKKPSTVSFQDELVENRKKRAEDIERMHQERMEAKAKQHEEKMKLKNEK